MKAMSIMNYELVIRAKKRFNFIPKDLRYFDDHFVCRGMSETWEVPPAVENGKSYPVPDFVLWMLRAPLVSERAKDCLSGLCEADVEFLPFHKAKGKNIYAMNVLSTDSKRAVFKQTPKSVVLVDERFGAIMRDNRLTGAELADPNDDVDRKVAMGETVNAFPGLYC